MQSETTCPEKIQAAAPPTLGKDLGQNIVVLDRGFVYVGQVRELHDRIIITKARNIRYWGTTEGLGELRNGPTKETKLDDVGSLMAYRHAIIHMIPCQGF